MCERLSELEKWRIAELSAPGLPSSVDRQGDRARAHRTVCGSSPGDASTAGARADAVAVAVVVA